MASNFHDECLDSYSDADLAQFMESAPRIPMSSVYTLSTTLLAKVYDPLELEDALRSLELAQQFGIHVPKIKRTFQNKGHAYCVMERIPGLTLEEAWPKLSWFKTIKLAFQLRHSVTLLRSVTSSTAGSLLTGQCRSFWFEDFYGLPDRSEPAALTSFLSFWVNFTSMRQAMQAAKCDSIDRISVNRVPPVPQTFVFTHHDLAPRNILLDPSSQMWLLDWDHSGFYPIYFEYAAMQNFRSYHNWGLFARFRWNIFSWIAVGRYEVDARILRSVRSKFTRFARGRRWELLRTGWPTGRRVY